MRSTNTVSWFLCPYDVEEGKPEDDGGLPAYEARLDETLQEPGDILHYLYDNGNNAFCNIGRTPLADIIEEDWDRALAVNITGVFLCMKYEIKAMLERGSGSIVNIGSGNEHSSAPGLAWYLGAKQATYGMTKVAALDYGAMGIRVNAVGPGSIWTPALHETAKQMPQHVETLAARSPMGRLAEPEEVAEAAVWLCTPRASYVLGHTLVADGGAVLG
jgi:NAD(P)-dependent dehydrogenase (short-subunit alcohol dehydrogenase family)